VTEGLAPTAKATGSTPASPANGGGSTTLPLGMALGLVVAAQFVLQLDFSIVNVALPTIKLELHFVPADLQWIVTGYALTFGSLLLFGGRVGDLAGHRASRPGHRPRRTGHHRRRPNQC
jgi:MFS family permease